MSLYNCAIINKYLYCYFYSPTLDDHMIDESGLAIIDEAPIVLGSNDYEMIESFRKLNVSRPIALTLACLIKGKVITSQEIEILTRLRQPEVSIAMRYLHKNNWIKVNEEKKSTGKGRPTKLYRLTVPMNQIINVIEEKTLEENRLVLRNIEYLKKMSDV
jgi:predicted transcriptional regulator